MTDPACGMLIAATSALGRRGGSILCSVSQLMSFITHSRRGGIYKTPDFDFLIINVLALRLLIYPMLPLL
jgi:hypothetical protein